MANKIVVNTGKLWIAKIAMTNGNPKLDTNVTLHLFVNNVTLVRGTVLGGVTEASFPGYSSVVLTGASDGGIDANNWDTWTWPTATFVRGAGGGGAQTCYGYYVTDNANTTLLWGENFTTPQVITNPGDGFTLPPTLSFGSLFNN